MIASMWIGNLMLNHHQPAAGRPSGVRLLRVPYRLMFPLDRDFFCGESASTPSNNAPGRTSSSAGRIRSGSAYWLIKHDFEPAPLLLGNGGSGRLMEEESAAARC